MEITCNGLRQKILDVLEKYAELEQITILGEFADKTQAIYWMLKNADMLRVLPAWVRNSLATYNPQIPILTDMSIADSQIKQGGYFLLPVSLILGDSCTLIYYLILID